MTKVSVHFEFESVAEATSFFADHNIRKESPPAAATVSAIPVTTPVPMSASAATAIPATATAGPTAETTVDHSLAVRTSMSEMVSRLDQKAPGSGAVKAKELLTKHGFVRARDVTSDKAPALIADFQSAA